jgi:hypothetical protein
MATQDERPARPHVLISRFDIAVLLLVVADMITTPFS